MEAICRAIESDCGEALVCLHLREQDVLRLAAGPSLPTDLRDPIATLRLDGDGPDGIASARSAVVCARTSLDKQWPSVVRQLAAHDVVASASEPLIGRTDGEVVATLTGFLVGPEEGTPERVEQLVDALRQGGYLARMAIEQKRANEDATAFEDRLDQALEVTRSGIWEVDLRTNRGTLSRHVFELMELDAPEDLAMPVDEFLGHVHPDDIERVSQQVTNAIAGQQDYSCEYRLRREKTGDYRWVRATGRVVEFDGDESTHMVGQILDIHDSVRGEDLLRRERDFSEGCRNILEMITEESPLADILAATCCLAETSRACSRAAVLLDDGQRIRVAAAPSWLPDLYRAEGVELAFDGPSRATRVRTVRSHDPSEQTFGGFAARHGLPVSCSTPLLSPEGKPIGMLEVASPADSLLSVDDLRLLDDAGRFAALAIEQDRLRAARRESEERLQAVVWASNAGFWDWRPDEETIYCNDNLLTMLGYPADTDRVPSTWLGELIHPDDLHLVVEASQDAIENDVTHDVEFRMRKADGDYLWLRSVGRVVERDQDERALRIVGQLVEIEDAKRIEIELREARERAEEANQTKGEFLANMSHEIRTPLTAILGFCELLEAGELENEADNRTALRSMRNNGEHLLSIIQDILDLSKIEAGRLEVERIPMQLREIAEDLSQIYVKKCDAKGLEFRLEFDEQLDATVLSDPTRVRQILINLTDNAIKFTGSGHVAIKLQRHVAGEGDEALPERCRGPGGYVQLTVEDTGIGMNDAQSAKVFEAFVQADTSTTRRFGGTGLGLRITQHLSRLLGGEIRLTSRFGYGSRFEVLLPFEVAPAENSDPAVRAPDAKGLPLAGLRVLVAEDGPDNRRLIEFVLRKAGAQVTFAVDGQEAVDSVFPSGKLTATPPDLVLMDMQMPVMDGYSATRTLRQLGYDGAIVALTANAMSEDASRCLQAGCDAYQAKPINRKSLIEALREHAFRRSCAG